MLSTSARLLRLAGLLQDRRHWTGPALAEALGIDRRTLRRDVARLRELGYPVQASTGVGGGYALGRGAELPPLLLDDDEAVALSLALHAAAGSVAGIEETALRLLAKLDQLLPERLRRRAGSLHAVTLALRAGAPLVDARMLTRLATACRDQHSLRFGYRDHHGRRSRREVEPLRLANLGRRWYLLAWDAARADWRSFRVDRIEEPAATGARCMPRPVPPDLLADLERGIALAPFPLRITLRLQGSLGELATRIPAWCGQLETDGPRHCLLHVGADSEEALAAQLAMVGLPAQRVSGSGHRAGLRRVIDRLAALVD
jgi:predicted DNA-binding transcriptional regulator YafY